MPTTATRFHGDFEIHLTLSRPGDRLEAWAAGAGLKVVHIELARGAVPVQPMLTLVTAGELAEARSLADTTARQATSAGFAVSRVKIEAAPWAAGVPRTDAEARELGPSYYFEHHVKVVTDAPIPAPDARHAAHVSRNARRVRADGRAERFVTQRCRQVGLETAGRRLDALLAEMSHHHICSVEREFVVLDSNESLDEGWIDQ